MRKTRERLMEIYDLMFTHFGPRHWWPGETPFEVIVGAILTQSVSWANVEKAIKNLKDLDILDPHGILDAPDEVLENAVRSTRYYKQKAVKLRSFCRVLTDEFDGDLGKMFALNLNQLRDKLLSIKGVGPETADSIILYAAEKPIFVVDAYTRRIFSRLGFFSENISYEDMQAFFMKHLQPDVQFYNEYHAQIDGIGHFFCSNTRAKCSECPLSEKCGGINQILKI
ncbi:MAG: endonuclease III domain-containing protein [Candidatus Saccharibacteria bacterium]